VVVAWLDDCPEFVACLVAVAATGAAMLPLNPGWRVPELQRVLDRLPVKGVITKSALHGPWGDLSERIPADRVIEIDEPAIRGPARLPGGMKPTEPSPRPDETLPAYYVTSSGSTGAPKIIARSHRLVVEGTAATAKALAVTRKSVFISVTPFYVAGSLSGSLLLPLLSGATIVILPVFTPSAFLAAIREHEVNAFVGSPAVFELLVRYGSDLGSLASLEVCV
jgi:long-chain acyl-CoA synthetase